MDRNGKNLIVTEVPTIEIDGRFFQTLFEAERYLVQTKWMRVSGARDRVKELVHEALNRPIDEGRRDFLRWAFSTASVIVCQWLWGKVDANWARDFWSHLSSSQKNKARRSYLHDFLPNPTTRSIGSGNYNLSLLKIFTQSPHCNIPTLDDLIVGDLPQARASAQFLRNHITDSWLFTHMRPLGQYQDTHALSYLSEIGCRNIHRASISKIWQNILRNRIASFNTIVDANPLLRHTFDRGFVELIDIAWDVTEEGVHPEESFFMYFTRRLHDSLWVSPDFRDSNEVLQALTSMRKRIAEFLRKYPIQNQSRFNFEQLVQAEKAQNLREIQSDPNWYHACEILAEPPIVQDEKQSRPETVTPNGQWFHKPEIWLGAFDGMIKIAEIFEIK